MRNVKANFNDKLYRDYLSIKKDTIDERLKCFEDVFDNLSRHLDDTELNEFISTLNECRFKLLMFLAQFPMKDSKRSLKTVHNIQSARISEALVAVDFLMGLQHDHHIIGTTTFSPTYWLEEDEKESLQKFKLKLTQQKKIFETTGYFSENKLRPNSKANKLSLKVFLEPFKCKTHSILNNKIKKTELKDNLIYYAFYALGLEGRKKKYLEETHLMPKK